MRKPVQVELALYRGSWGGWRPNAGRPRLKSGRVPHLPREGLGPKYPWLVTLKVREGLASLRTVAVVREVEDAFRRMRGREGFRLTHYSIQGNHLHAIVEARDSDALGRGMKALGIRFARAVNRALRRKGPVVWDRYHAKVLKTPTQVRNAVRYVLSTPGGTRRRRGGAAAPGPVRLDPASSARSSRGGGRGSREGKRGRLRRPRSANLARGSSCSAGGSAGCSIHRTFPGERRDEERSRPAARAARARAARPCGRDLAFPCARTSASARSPRSREPSSPIQTPARTTPRNSSPYRLPDTRPAAAHRWKTLVPMATSRGRPARAVAAPAWWS